MKYLILATKYTTERNDDFWFKNLYTGFREYNGIRDSVWKSLSYLYGNKIADELLKTA